MPEMVRSNSVTGSNAQKWISNGRQIDSGPVCPAEDNEKQNGGKAHSCSGFNCNSCTKQEEFRLVDYFCSNGIRGMLEPHACLSLRFSMAG